MDPRTGGALLLRVVTNERALLSGSDRKKPRSAYHSYVRQAGKQTYEGRHIRTMVQCIVVIGNGEKPNNNNGETD